MDFNFNQIVRRLLRCEWKDWKANETLNGVEANSFIGSAVSEGRPFLAGRLGWLEAYFLGYTAEHRSLNRALREKLWNTPGIFPATDKEFERFRKSYIDAAGAADLLGLMHSPYEGFVVKNYARQARTCALESLEPYFASNPWSHALDGKTVLVVHPFAKSIEQQFRRREELFDDAKVLPDFTLRTLRPPQTMCGNTGGYESWTQALHDLSAQVLDTEFDAAIVGCGSYGLPLGAVIKHSGRPCVHLGGATQVLFGLIGKRWEENPRFASLIKSSWQRPDESEKPKNYHTAEGGCYW